MMLSTDNIREIAGKVEYKDGWQFRACDDPHLSRPRLLILADVPNSHQTGGTISVGITPVVPPCETPSQFLEWMLHKIIEAETHDARELFKYDGMRLPECGSYSALNRRVGCRASYLDFLGSRARRFESSPGTMSATAQY
jgi:hypothetical protein